MAQAGYTPIQMYHSTTPGNAPTAADLLPGELAINIADGIIYYEDDAGVVQQFTSGGGSATADNGIFVNANTVSTSYTIASGYNGLSAGPVTVNSGVTVTISSGSVWTVV